MDTGPHRSRDEPEYDLSDAVYSTLPMLPSRGTNTCSSIRRSRASSPAKTPNKRLCKPTPHTDTSSPLSIKLSPSTMNASWYPTSKCSVYQPQQLELHQSTCLNLNAASTDTSEADFWILPDFDDWELDAETPRKEPTQKELGALLRRAASSNRERLRARLEGDGWDFVGGKYGEEEKVIQGMKGQEDMVDEEFDVVVLPVVEVSC